MDQIYAQADGVFELTGQFAVSSPDATVKEFVKRFAIETPVSGTGPSATAQALAELTRQVSLAM